jgi:hypothetical protein
MWLVPKYVFLRISSAYALKLRQDGDTRRLLAYLAYLFDLNHLSVKNIKTYATEWGVDVVTATAWRKEFQEA